MRLDHRTVFPPALKAMMGLEKVIHSSSLEPELLELVKIRASQINGCGHCLDMHTKDAEAMGIASQRLHLVAAWEEAPVYSDRERAALEWCEVLTLLANYGAPDEAYEAVAAVFSDEEVVALTLAVIAINGWNRLNVAFDTPVGDYVAGSHARQDS